MIQKKLKEQHAPLTREYQPLEGETDAFTPI